MPKSEFATYITDLLQCVGPVYAKRMFGGHGLYLDGRMFALIAGNELYLKTDATTVADFSARGLQPFTFYRQGKPFSMSYYQAPEEVFEDQDAMRVWGNKAFGAALRAQKK